MRARHDLHFRKHVAERLGVASPPTPGHGGWIVGNRERRPRQNIPDYGFPLRADRLQIGTDSSRKHLPIDIIRLEHLAGEPHQVVQRFLRTVMTFRSTIAEAEDPFAGVSNMVAHFLEALRRDAGELLVRAPLKLLEHVIAERIEEKLPDDGESKITFRQLDHLYVAIVDRIAEIREIIFGPAFSFGLGCKLQ